MKHWFMIALSTSLLILLSALFILSCNLNHRQYLANVQAIKGDLLAILNNETSALRDRIMTREKEIFALFNEPGLPFDLYAANQLFTINEGRVCPAGLSDIHPQSAIDAGTARKALELGYELQKSDRTEKAREYFETATRITISNPDDLDTKISAYMELLKMSAYRNPRLVFDILYAMFDHPNSKLDETRTKKYEEILRTNINHFEKMRNQSMEMWKTANGITKVIGDRPAPFKTLYEQSILSVNVKGQALLLPLETVSQGTSNKITQVSATAPGSKAAISHQMRSIPIYTWIPAGEFEARTQSAERAYRLTNIMLVILLVVMAGMGISIAIILKRQHEMTRLKSSFVSAVSHELRTPMALIRLYESLTSEDRPPEMRERYTRAIMAETDRLSALVNNVLDFARMERENMTLNIRDTNISELINEALDSFRFRMEKENITLIKNIQPNLMAAVDPLAMTQVIFNLMDNAIKYSGENHKIEVELSADKERKHLRVKDDGIGIPDALKPRIFMPFVRGSDNRVTAQRGSGIGLSITHQLLEKMHSSIRVFDNIPAGTVFEVTLPSEGIGQNENTGC